MMWRTCKISTNISISIICSYIYLVICTYLSTYLSIYLSICLNAYLSTYLSLPLSNLSVLSNLNVCLSTPLSTYPSVYPSIPSKTTQQPYSQHPEVLASCPLCQLDTKCRTNSWVLMIPNPCYIQQNIWWWHRLYLRMCQICLKKDIAWNSHGCNWFFSA